MAFVHRGLELCQGVTLERSLFLPGMGMDSKFPRREQRRRMISLVPISQNQHGSDHLGKRFKPRMHAVLREKPSAVAREKPVQFDVEATVTVRRKCKEALRETIDSLIDAGGCNIVLYLVSEEIDPKTKSVKKSKEAVLKC